MDELLRWLAGAKGMHVTDDSELALEFAAFPSGGRGLLVLLGIAAVLGIVVFAYARDAHRLTRARRLVLTSLRVAAVVLTCLLLLDPQLVAVRREVRPGQTLVLVDGSQSMAQVDGFRHPEVQALATAWRELGVRDPGATSRVQLAQTLLGRDDGALLETLRAHNRVLVWSFAAGLEPIASLELRRDDEVTQTPATPRFDARALRAEGSYTNLGGAVREALGRAAAANVAAVILLTDGRRNLGPQGAEVARLLRNRAVPATLIVPIGDPSPVRTVRLVRLDAPEKVFQKDPFTIRAWIEGKGYVDTLVTTRLVRRSDDGASEVLRTEQVAVRQGQAEAEIAFQDLSSDVPGVHTFAVEIDPPELEAPSPERHVIRTRIEVLGERMRVLLIAGGPSHEFRILRNLLIRDKTIDVSCWLLSADPGFPQDGDIRIEKLPATREELEAFDVFVFLDPDSERLEPAFATLVAQQVQESGAGLFWACGEKYTLDALREGSRIAPIAELLPVVVDMEAADASIGLARGMPATWPFELSPAGRAHPALRIADDRTASEALWSRVPGFHFAFPVDHAKPAAQVLVEHHKPHGAGEVENARPLIAAQFVGAGRVMFNATDDTYRWRTILETAYDRFWVRSIRFLFEGKIAAGNSRLRVLVDEARVELGQAVKVTAEARTETFEPVLDPSLELVMQGEDGSKERVSLAPVEGVPGRFETFVRPTATGFFRIEPTETVGGRAVTASFQVVPAALEKEGPVDLAELAAIAALPGGRVVERPTDLLSACASIASQTRIESFTSSDTLWDAWWTVAALLGLLGLEWWLRKRANLL